MAYINKLIDINANISDTETNINTVFDNVNDAIKINAVVGGGGGGGDGKALLYNGAGTVPITATTVDLKKGIDMNIINNSITINDTNINNAFDNINNAIKANIVSGGGSGSGKAYLHNGAGTTQISATGNSLDVNITNTVNISNSTLDVSDLFATDTTLTTLSGKINSDNVHPDAIQVEVKNTSVPITGTFFQATQPVSGTLGVSDLFATDATLSSLSGKINNDNINTDAIQVQIKNTSVPITGTFYQATQPVSGTLGVSDLFATDATLSSLSGKINNDNTLVNSIRIVDANIDNSFNNNAINVGIVSGAIRSNGNSYTYGLDTIPVPINASTVGLKNGLNTNVINTSLTVSDTNIPVGLSVVTNNLQVVEPNLTNAYNAGESAINTFIKNANQIETTTKLHALNTSNAGLYQLTSTEIIGTGTKECLDVAIKNTNTTNGKLLDKDGLNITSTILGSKRGIDMASSLYVAGTALTSTTVGLIKSLDVNVNNTLTVTDTNINNSYDAINTALRTNIVSGSITDTNAFLYDGSGSNSIASTTIYTSPSTAIGINTASSLYVSNGTTSTALTSTSNALDVDCKNTTDATAVNTRLNNASSNISSQNPTTSGSLVALSVKNADATSYINAIDTKTTTTTSGSMTGINMYTIPSKSTYILFGCYNEVNEAISGITVLTGLQPTNVLLAPDNATYKIGTGNLKTFSYWVRNWVSNKTIFVRYCDGSNNLQTTTVTATAVAQTLASNIINVISCELAGSNQTLGATEYIEIYHTAANPTISLGLYNYYAAWITIPTGYRGIMKNFQLFANSGETLRIYKYNSSGMLNVVREWVNASNFGSTMSIQYFTAGETFFWGTSGGIATLKKIQGLLELEYIA